MNGKEKTAIPAPVEQLVKCPFCLEDDFDLIGLKNHFLKGHCDKFNETEAVRPIVRLPKRERKQWRCTTCGFVFTGGDPGGVFAEYGLIWCANCTDLRKVHDNKQKGLMREIST